ncbi:Protein N-lysine methyltransferase METTL21A [Camellia lanceoleosa]|uniref:Protein N-lysine methyltransferase METTL21A n=1 Tax=Camellia lanceoleosa TaxID=1840588 RepID=A0ACC0IXG3_9ERIC|nr:Protein N-lysine methyltransferase METTL21A [Camellia lanceoleosa]
MLWDSGVVLGKFLEHAVESGTMLLQGKKVVELGSGCGLVGCIVALLGAEVILTDLPDRLRLLRKNVGTNLCGNVRSSTAVSLLIWGEKPVVELIRPLPDYAQLLQYLWCKDFCMLQGVSLEMCWALLGVVLVHEITQEVCAIKNSGTDAKNGGHTIKDKNSQVVQKEVQENSGVVDKELHQKEVHEITQQAIVTKDCETNAKDERHTPKDQNSQLQNQLVEEEVHDLTQQACAIKVDDLTESRQTNLQNSMVIKIKAKARKTTEISDYKYGGKKVRVKKEKENKDETISNKYAVAQLLPLEDKYKLQILWKEKQTKIKV